MAKLTNRQLDVLAARVVDLLEEQYKIESDKIKETDEYKRFKMQYTDDTTELLTSIQVKARRLKSLKEEIDTEIKKLSSDVYVNRWALENNTEVVEDYLEKRRDEAFPTARFDRDKTLRRVEADIILGDVSNPEELIKSLVTKLK
jgi:hypothetical protein